jgi:DNA-binding NarL/FixJ family response regulator
LGWNPPRSSCLQGGPKPLAVLRELAPQHPPQRRLRHPHRAARLAVRAGEIARLVVDRKTNPEIAGELVLSQKTVESHMRNLFQKLGVSSRTEVARVIERAER